MVKMQIILVFRAINYGDRGLKQLNRERKAL